jgi:polyhydroxybutyrate depolymerase
MRRSVGRALGAALLVSVVAGAGGCVRNPGGGTTTTRPGGSVGRLACGGSPTAADRADATVSLSSGGQNRTYLRQLPSTYDAQQPLPLVINLHGFSQSGRAQENLSGMGAFGKSRGFITVSPNGLGSPPYWDTQENSRDTVFIGALLDQTASQLCVDRTRVYVSGMSNGAFFAASVACRYPDRIAAVAGAGGLRYPAWCHSGRPVPALAFHGTADTFVRYEGGIGSSAAVLPAPDGSGRTLGQVGAGGDERFVPATFRQAAPAVIEQWATRNGCSLPLRTTAVASDVSLLSATCPSGAAAALYRVSDGGHTWPGGTSSGVGSIMFGRTTRSISATSLIWEHFSRYALPS